MNDFKVYCPKPKRPAYISMMLFYSITSLLFFGLSMFGVFDGIKTLSLTNPLFGLMCRGFLMAYLVTGVCVVSVFTFRWIIKRPIFYFDLQGTFFCVFPDGIYAVNFDNTPHNNPATISLAKHRRFLNNLRSVVEQDKQIMEWFKVIGFISIEKLSNFELLECNNKRTILYVRKDSGTPTADYFIYNTFDGYNSLVNTLKEYSGFRSSVDYDYLYNRS